MMADFIVEVYRRAHQDEARFFDHPCDGRYEAWPTAERALLNAIVDDEVDHVVLRLASER